MRMMLLTFALMVISSSIFAKSEAALPPPCFDFNSKITATLVPTPTPSAKEADPYDFGRKARDSTGVKYEYGLVSGVVKKPIEKVYEMMLDPRTVRPDTATKISLKEVASGPHLKVQDLSIFVQPVFFITLEWQERWAYSLVKGTKEKPESILVSYEKTGGTSHIRHLCGQILIEKISPDQSGVFLFEEIDADRRDAKDQINGVRGTLVSLRAEIPPKK